MPPRKFVNKIKSSKLPYHVVEDSSVPHNLLCDQTVFNQLKRNSNIHANLDFSMVMVGLTEASPDLQLTDRSNISKRSTTARRGKLERQNTFEVRQPSKDYFGAVTSISSLATTKIKCKSMERVGLKDLAYFYRYKQTLKAAKRTCDLNMIHLLEVLRKTFSGHKKETLHQISSEVSQSIVQFISSSVTELRFGRCKTLLQKFEEAETRVSDLLNIPSTNKLSQPTSPLTVNQSSKLTPRSHEKLTPSSIKPLPDDKSDTSADRSIENKQTLKLPNLSLKNYFPVLCNPSPQSIGSKNGPKLSVDSKNVKIDFEEMIGQRELLSILGRVKYCVWSVGHLIQYDRISNSNLEKLIKYTSQKRGRIAQTGKRGSVHTPVTTPGGQNFNITPRTRRDSTHTNNGNRSHELPSLEFDNEPIVELATKVDDFSDMKNIKNYMFNYSNLLDDLDEEKVAKRLDNLSKYSVWKMKKWVTNFQRGKIEQKHQDYKVVCKICALELKIDIAKEHLDLCKNRAELNQETKNLDKKFAEFVMEAFIKSKNINTKLILDGNNYAKLKNRYLKFDGGSGTVAAKRLFTQKLKTDIISSPANTDSPHARSPDKDGLDSPAKKKILMRGKTMKIQSNFLAELQQGEQVNTPEKKPKHIGIVRMNTINPDTEPSTAAELKPKASVLNTSNLLKSYHHYADSPVRRLGEASQPKLSLDPRSSIKTTDSSKSRKNNLKLHFYSDVNRSDIESDHSVDSRHSKESYASAPIGRLEIQNLAEYSNMQFSDLSSTERSASSSTTQSPAMMAGKNFISPIGKSAFFKEKDTKILNLEESMRKVDTQEDEECKDHEQESQLTPEQSSHLIEETESSIIIPRLVSDDQHPSPLNDQKPQTVDKNSINQIAKQMAKLKIEIDRKKVIIAFYEFIMAKAKQVTNQELESEMIEIVRDDAEIEIKNFNSRIDDEEAASFAKKFLNTLNKRLLASTNLFEVTQRLDVLQGKADDQGSNNKKFLDRKASMLFISNRYGSPKGNNPVDSFGLSLSGSRILSRTPPSANTPKHRRNNSNRTNDGRHGNPNKERPKVYESKENDKEFSINNQAETFDQGENITHKESDKTDRTDQTGEIASHRKPHDEHENGKLAVEDLSSSDTDESCDHESEDKNGLSFRDDRSDNNNPNPQKEEEDAMFKRRQERYPTLNPEESFSKETGKAMFETAQEQSTSAGDSQVRIQLSQELEMKTPDFMKSFADTVYIDPFDPIAKNSPQTPSFDNKIFQTPPSKFNFGQVSNAKSLADMKREMFQRSATNDFEKLVKNILNTDSSPKKVHKTQIINPRPFMEDDMTSPAKPVASFFKNNDPAEEHSEMSSTKADRKTRSQRNSITEPPKLIVRGFDKNGRTIVDSSPKLPTDIPAAQGSTPKTKRRLSASQMFEMFEDKGTYNMNRLPSLNKIKPDVEGGDQEVYDEDDSPPHKSPDFAKKTGKFFAEDAINGSNEDLKDSVGSQWLIESPVIQKGYYSDSHVKNVKIKIQKKPQIGIHDFEQVKLISKGAFGKVCLVKRKATNDYYAMKLINLGEKTMKNSVKELENLRKEDKIFGLTQKQGVSQKDFIVRADFTFTHETYICFVMEYIIGGDFGDIMHNYGCLDQNVAKFYIAEIILALEYLHSLGIVHRDLKPDNVLLDKKGHVKLTDFGLSDVGLSRRIKNGNLSNSDANIDSDVPSSPEKSHFRQTVRLIMNGKTLEKKHEVIYKENYDKLTPESLMKDSREASNPDFNSGSDKKKGSRKKHRLIGTPDYMPPEIIQGISLNNPTIDWWSLGVILFEFLCGVPPFNDESPKQIYQNILERRIPWDQVEIGYEEDCITPEAQDLINQLLTLDHTKRIGSNGASEIKNHPFFAGISWDTLRTQRAPIIPEQKGAEDTENFVRLKDKITDKDKEVFISALMKQIEQNPNMVAAKQLLEAHPEIFDMFNYSALYSDNVKSVDEILKKMKKELDEFEECDDNIFDLPKWLLNNDKELNSKDSLDSNKDLQEK